MIAQNGPDRSIDIHGIFLSCGTNQPYPILVLAMAFAIALLTSVASSERILVNK